MNKPKNISGIIAISLFLILSSTNFFRVVLFDFRQGFSEQVLNDMAIFMAAGKEFIKSGRLYERSNNYPEKYGPDAPVYKFPPAYQLTIVPFLNSGISDTDFLTFNRCAYLFIYLASISMLVFIAGKALLKTGGKNNNHHLFCSYATLAAVLACWYSPFREVYLNLHTEILILFLITLCLLLAKKLPVLAGVTLSFAVSIKIYPVFILIYYLATQQWRVVAGFIIGFVLFFLFCVFYFGPVESVFYIETILPILLNQAPVNHSQNLMLEKFLYSYGLIDEMNGHLHSMIKYAMLVILVFIAATKEQSRLRSSTLYFGMFVSGTLIWLPNYWLQYQMILVIPILALLALVMQSRSPWLAVMITTIVIIMCAQDQWYETINLVLLQKIHETSLLDYFNSHSLWQSFIHALSSAPSLTLMFLLAKIITWLCDLKALVPELLFIISAWIVLVDKNYSARLVFSVPPST